MNNRRRGSGTPAALQTRMLIEVVHVRPGRWDQDRQALKSVLQESTMAAVLVDNTVDWDTLADIARVVTASRVAFVATYGERSEELHDLIDVMAISVPEPGPITTFENDGIDDFLFNITLVYPGCTEIADSLRKTVICYASEVPIPGDLSVRVAKIKRDANGGDETERQQRLKDLYADFTRWLLSRFDGWDPQGIVLDQKNEYAPEVRRIVPLLRETKSAEELARLIHAVFVKMFDAEIAGPEDVYRPFASEIMDEWQKRWGAVWAD